MIESKNYMHDLYELLPRSTHGEFMITHGTARAGGNIQTYNSAGLVHSDQLRDDFPFVRLSKRNYLIESSIMMTDCPFEQESMRVPVAEAYGDVLVIGLGIGLFPVLLRQRNKRVRTVTIVEKEADVFGLVFPRIRSAMYPGISIIIDDGWDYMGYTKTKYDFVFIDVSYSIMSAVRDGPLWADRAKLCLSEKGVARFWLQELHKHIHAALDAAEPSRSGGLNIYDPCYVCAKTLRCDFNGLCLDCADELGVSEMFIKEHHDK